MRFISRSASLLPLAILAPLTGCSTLNSASSPFSDGWREGRVVQVSPASEIPRPGYWRCLRAMPTDSRTKAQYAVVAYSRFGRARQRLVAVPADLNLAKNDTVYVNLNRCEDAIVRPRH